MQNLINDYSTILNNLKNLKQAFIEKCVTHGIKEVDISKTNKIKLKYLGLFSKGNGITKDDISNGDGINAILYGELFTKYHFLIEKNVTKISRYPKNTKMAKPSDILIPLTTTAGDA
jgi:hypothetical protein